MNATTHLILKIIIILCLFKLDCNCNLYCYIIAFSFKREITRNLERVKTNRDKEWTTAITIGLLWQHKCPRVYLFDFLVYPILFLFLYLFHCIYRRHGQRSRILCNAKVRYRYFDTRYRWSLIDWFCILEYVLYYV